MSRPNHPMGLPYNRRGSSLLSIPKYYHEPGRDPTGSAGMRQPGASAADLPGPNRRRRRNLPAVSKSKRPTNTAWPYRHASHILVRLRLAAGMLFQYCLTASAHRSWHRSMIHRLPDVGRGPSHRHWASNRYNRHPRRMRPTRRMLLAKRPTANGRANVTRCCGPSLLARFFSSWGEPITKLPSGITIISGQLPHSLKLCFGFDISSAIVDRDGTRVWASHSTRPSVAARINNAMINAPRTIDPQHNSPQ